MGKYLLEVGGKLYPLEWDDAEAIAQLLETHGNFRVKRFPSRLLFFAGHGLRKQLRPNLTQGFLAASDVNISDEFIYD